eukprot:GABV01002440.1.p1 GENE.GABV01002440.1~~GABV01002440.1.p1  ORF type:complete len:120 (+),score=31.58 GABV01002440.1:331-690(+)
MPLTDAERAQCEPAVARALETGGPLILQQETPIRVLHRRSLMTRPKEISKMSFEWLDEHYFTLDIEAQAGTYIKEFVHGDRGRTTPNVGTILGCEADILQLDVLSLHYESEMFKQLGFC